MCNDVEVAFGASLAALEWQTFVGGSSASDTVVLASMRVMV